MDLNMDLCVGMKNSNILLTSFFDWFIKLPWSFTMLVFLLRYVIKDKLLAFLIFVLRFLRRT